MRGWADRGGALLSTDWRQIDLSPPSPSPSFLLYLFFTKSHSTFPIIFRILSLIDHLWPRCFLTHNRRLQGSFQLILIFSSLLLLCCQGIKKVPEVGFEVGACSTRKKCHIMSGFCRILCMEMDVLVSGAQFKDTFLHLAATQLKKRACAWTDR